MIHSLSGGVIKSSKNYNFIKVEDGLGGFIWLACDGFSAMVGEDSARSSLYLSAGTMDQLYLSVRLALCKLTVPEAPILLDDALCAFDDTRTELALKTLAKLSNQRQIMLFSCHSREADWARAQGVPVVSI